MSREPPTPETLAFVGTSDLSGLLRGISLPWSALEGVMGRGVVLPGHVPLLHPRDPSPFGAPDLLLLPDPAARAYVPAAPDAPDIHLLLGDLLELDGAPWACCPRYFLRRGLAALHSEFGLGVRAGFDHGFVLPGAVGPGWSLGALRHRSGLLGHLAAALRTNGLTPDTIHATDAVGSFEIGAAGANGVAGADAAVVARELIAAVCAREGQAAPELGRMRIRWTPVNGFGEPALADGSGEHGLSDEAEHMLAGVMHHWPVLAAILAPRAGWYGAGRAAVRSELATEGRPGPLRLLADIDDEGASAPTEVQLNCADGAASPYLALGAVVWAGLDGLRHHRRLGEQPRLAWPDTLAAALDAFAESVPAAEWFGMAFREQFLRYGRREAALVAS